MGNVESLTPSSSCRLCEYKKIIFLKEFYLEWTVVLQLMLDTVTASEEVAKKESNLAALLLT
jgi:hypothetical protein